MDSSDIYLGPDRGHFKAARLPDRQGFQQMANCRIKEATVYNYITKDNYAIVAYKIEWWKDKPPHEGGESHLFVPATRPTMQTLTLRVKSGITSKLLYLEDAIISDFLTVKLMQDPMTFQFLEQERAAQVDNAKQWMALEDSDKEIRHTLHTSVLQANDTQPLTLMSTHLSVTHRTKGDTGNGVVVELTDYPFTTRRACLGHILQTIA